MVPGPQRDETVLDLKNKIAQSFLSAVPLPAGLSQWPIDLSVDGVILPDRSTVRSLGIKCRSVVAVACKSLEDHLLAVGVFATVRCAFGQSMAGEETIVRCFPTDTILKFKHSVVRAASEMASFFPRDPPVTAETLDLRSEQGTALDDSAVLSDYISTAESTTVAIGTCLGSSDAEIMASETATPSKSSSSPLSQQSPHIRLVAVARSGSSYPSARGQHAAKQNLDSKEALRSVVVSFHVYTIYMKPSICSVPFIYLVLLPLNIALTASFSSFFSLYKSSIYCSVAFCCLSGAIRASLLKIT